MQFHLNGFRPGDPEIPDHVLKRDASAGSLPKEVDVLIVGCGPAGLTLAAQLSAFPDINTLIVDQKAGPLLLGQADGIACRTMEMFEAFGFSERVKKEGYWVNETTFWRPDQSAPHNIVRSGRVQDVEDGLSEFPHIILNQARVHDFYLNVMRNSPGQLNPDYSLRCVGLQIDAELAAKEPRSFPVSVSLECVEGERNGKIETIKARYVVGCDGARSGVRQSLGRALHGDSANQAWGVMDVLVVTDFPDIRFKSVIQSANEGNILLIPREGGYLTRIYIELDKLRENERAANRNLTVDDLIAAAQRVFQPYKFDVKEVAWWSVYDIGQRLCDKFDDVPADQIETRSPRVFIAGDACHTHSPKAGQGMNVSMQDAFNLGWKLKAVLRGECAPEFLHTYSSERQSIAKELIDFDREWAAMVSAPLKKSPSDTQGVSPEEVRDYFVKHGRYTAGTVTRYTPSLITGEATHQNLAKGFPIGARFHSAPVIRVGDAKTVELGHTIKADGRWRVFAFAGQQNPTGPSSSITKLCSFLALDPRSPTQRYTPKGADIDSVIDVRGVFQQSHYDLDVAAMPALLLPPKGRYGLRDYEKAFCPDFKNGNDVFDMRGIDRERGCLIIVRPDQYVAHVLPIDAYDDLSVFFGRFMISIN